MNRIDKLFLELHNIIIDKDEILFTETGYILEKNNNEIIAIRQYNMHFGRGDVDALIDKIMEDNKKFKMYRKMYLDLIETPLIEKKLYISTHLEEL